MMDMNVFTLEELARSRQDELKREVQFIETYKLYTKPKVKKYSLTILGFTVSIERTI